MRHVGGSVVLDGVELPIADSRGDATASASATVSIIPQYAMSALNPTRKIGHMIDELLESRAALRSPSCARSCSAAPGPRRAWRRGVLDRYPIELSGGMKQRIVMVISTLLDPSLLIADEITSALDVSSQKAVAQTLVEFRDRAFVRQHDRGHPRRLDPVPDRRHAHDHVRRAGWPRRRPPDVLMEAPLHPYTRLLISSLPEIGRPVRRQAAGRDPRRAAVAAQPADGLPLPRPLPARLREVRGAAAVRRGRARATPWRAGRPPEMLTLERVSQDLQGRGSSGARRLRAVRDAYFSVARARSCR